MNLKGRARRWFQGFGPAEPPEPQYFRVSCAEGHLLRGVRTEGYQALRCPECGEGIFVLPRSPLPEPPRPSASARQQARQPASIVDDEPIPLTDPDPISAFDIASEIESQDELADGEIQWLDPVSAAMEDVPEPETETEPEAPTEPEPPAETTDRPRATSPLTGKSRARAGPRSAAGPTPTPTTRTQPEARPRGKPRPRVETSTKPVPKAPGDPRPLIAVPDRPSFGARFRRHRHALVFLAVTFVVVLTVFQVVRQQQSRDLTREIESGRTEGVLALDRGDFDTAHRLLSRASRAVQALGGEVSGAEEIRQAANEAAILVDLVPTPLEALLDERARRGEDQWRPYFEASYRNRSILLEARILPRREWPRPDVPELDYRILTPGPTRPRQGRIDLQGFRLFESEPPEPNSQVPLRFGARLSAVTPDPDSSDWLFQLEPDSGVFITHDGVLKALGWGPTPFASEARR
ncbi:hypothetical protein BH23PLA1_BH23PLA1_18380 [soil metagenome]